jgi:hypothetical protein
MAPERKKLFGCPSCGFRVTGTEDACPRCGAKFGPEARFECPFCGEVVTPLTKECPSCHIAYDDFVSKAEERVTDESIDSLLTEIIEIESKKVKEEAKKLSCPKCSWMVDGTEDNCPRCGTTFMDLVAYQCPICASLVHYDAEGCYECKAIFVVETADDGTCEAASVEEAPAEEKPETPVVAEESPVEDEPERQAVPEAEEEEPVRTPEATPQEKVAQETMPIETSEPKEEEPAEEKAPAEEEPVMEVQPPVVEDRPPAVEEPTERPKKVRRRKLKAKT